MSVYPGDTGGGTVYVRRDMWKLQQENGTWEPYTKYYALAVREMQKRQPTDPTSWIYQANIHGSWDQVPPGADWNQCQHASWWFLPWHRMYIFQFEAIVRAAVIQLDGPEDWALPYWNYSRPYPYNTLPPALRSPTMDDGTPNALYVPHPKRNPLPAPGINGGAQLTATTVDPTVAMNTPNFSPPPASSFGGGKLPQPQHFDSATGALEGRPHNGVHVAVGGSSNPEAPQGNWGWMTDPNMAARDPVFWLHHSNIDRLWAHWNQAGHPDAGDQNWLDQTFPLYDANKQRVEMKLADVLNPGTPQSKMNYRYDDLPEPGAPATPEVAAAAEGGGGGGGA
ncbi:MAG: tyrosinase family protein, partial [Actinomycetota bacterium]|nr:tyrosinase family protein [Actinomycetota bacterium]